MAEANVRSSPLPIRHRVRALPVLGGGMLAGGLGALLNELLGQAAIALLDIPAEFAPLRAGRPAFFTMLAGVAASWVLLLAYRFSRHPEVVFQSIAIAALIVSYAPVIAVSHSATAVPGTTPAAVGALGMMHLVAYAACVPWLLRRARRARVRD